MKKLYVLTILLMAVSFSTLAQAPFSFNPPDEQREPLPATESRDFLKGVQAGPGDNFSAWYDLGGVIQQDIITTDYNYFRNHLMPDSLCVLEFNSGYGSVWKHSFGMVLDPTSIWWNLSPNAARTLQDTTSFVLDSVGFFYRYQRPQSMFPDTVRIQVVRDQNIFLNNFSSDNRPYSRINYDTTLKRCPDAFFDTTIILTDLDTIFANGQGFLQVPVGDTVFGGGRFAATITSFPGNPYSLGDTVDAYLTTPPVNRINPFIVYEYADNIRAIDNNAYLNGLHVTQEIRYNISTNGWNGDYLPGNAWQSRFYYADCAFKVTTLDYDDGQIAPGIDAPLGSLESVKVFPNPTNGGNSTVSLTMNTTQQVRLDLFNLVGQKLITNQFIATQGINNVDLPTSEMAPGVYFARVTSPGSEKTLKIVVE